MAINQELMTMFRDSQSPVWNREIQQESSVIEPFVSIIRGCEGVKHELPFIGTTSMQEYTGSFQKIVHSKLKYGKRTIKKVKLNNVIPMSADDNMDLAKLTLTAANILPEQRSAWRRSLDLILLGVKLGVDGRYVVKTQADGVCGGILGPNYTGDDGDIIESLDASNSIPIDFVAKGTAVKSGLVLDKIAELKVRYLALGMTPQDIDDLVLCIGPKQYMEMLMWEQMQNKDYGFNCLSNGQINNFLGVRILVSNCLPLTGTSEKVRTCCAWLKSRAKVGIWRDAEFRVDNLHEYIDDVQQFVIKSAVGATRMDNQTVFTLPCVEK